MKRLIVCLAFLPSAAFGGSLYVQAEAMHVFGDKATVTNSRSEYTGSVTTYENCRGPYNCYAGHNLLSAEFGVQLGQWDFFIQHTSSADAKDNGIDGFGVRFREHLFSW